MYNGKYLRILKKHGEVEIEKTTVKEKLNKKLLTNLVTPRTLYFHLDHTKSKSDNIYFRVGLC